MEWFICIASTLLLSGLVVAGMCLAKKIKIFSGYSKAIALILGAVAFFAHLYRRVAVYEVRALDMYSPFGENMFQTAVGILLIWFTYAAILSAIMSAFFPYRALHDMNRFFSTTVVLLDLILIPTYLVARVGVEPVKSVSVFLVLTLVELALTLALCVGNWMQYYRLPTAKQSLTALIAIPCALFAIIPPFVPQAFIGFLDPTIKLYDSTPEHRIMLYLSVIIPFIIFHAIKNKSEDVKRFLMIYFSLGWLFSFMGRWLIEDFKDPTSLPLHLCHVAMMLIPLCLIFRMQRLFNFCLFINVTGAFFAMIFAGDLDGLNALGTERVSFWINHWAAFFMPVLLVALKLFRRPKFKEWAYSIAAFVVYFVSILFINAWFTNYGECDYFYINSDFIIDGLISNSDELMQMSYSFPVGDLTFTFYPLFQVMFFFTFIGITVGVWFLYALLFSMWDKAEERREKEKSYKMIKKELKSFLKGKNINEPMSGDGSPSLVISHFCKKYGNNNFYSVKDVSFSVNGGEIFGFLGPNGAGKSTIIKSIVGIQPISSGDIAVCGYHVEKQAVQAKANLGFVPDHYALYENLTGREYINFIADLYGVDKEYRDVTIQKYVERFQLVESFDNQMKTYSHGMKQKITIMAALVHNPKVWILDEPLTGLDPTSIHEVKECMREHAAAGNIVFFSSHIIDVVEKICDRIAIIKKGQLRACEKVSDLEAQGIELEQFYLSIINADDTAKAEQEVAKEAAQA